MSRRRPVATVARSLAALRVIHPAPSAINALLVVTLASIAGASIATATWLAIAMLGFQASIGALNDIVDRDVDRRWKPAKPIPAGLVSPTAAAAVSIVGAIVGLAISAAFGPLVLVLGGLGYASGAAYDVILRRHGLGWLAYAAAFPLLLAWTWEAAASTLPPGWPSLLPVAALAGPALHLANSLVDADVDERAERPSLATRSGPRRAGWLLALLQAAILLLAWVTLLAMTAVPPIATTAALLATAAVAVGVLLSGRERPRAREAGWLLQAGGLALLAAAWLASMAT